jgi:hypothetical protein
LGALLVGAAAGIVVLAAMLAGALILYRVFGDSWPALVLLLVVFGGLGAYLAWLVGVLVFSSVRNGGEEGPSG